LKKSKLAHFFNEYKFVQIIKRTLHWLLRGLLIASFIISLVIKEWFSAFIFFAFTWQKFSSRKAIQNRYISAFGFLIVVAA
jgi:hypothetical protein